MIYFAKKIIAVTVLSSVALFGTNQDQKKPLVPREKQFVSVKEQGKQRVVDVIKDYGSVLVVGVAAGVAGSALKGRKQNGQSFQQLVLEPLVKGCAMAVGLGSTSYVGYKLCGDKVLATFHEDKKKVKELFREDANVMANEALNVAKNRIIWPLNLLIGQEKPEQKDNEDGKKE